MSKIPSIHSYLQKPFEFEKELNLLFEPDDDLVILDIGACEGEDSIKFSKHFPNSSIYAFEPLPKNIELINVNLKKYKTENVKVINKALSDNNGKATFHVSSGKPPKSSGDWNYGNKSSSLLEPAKTKEIHRWLKFQEAISVSTERLDVLLKRENINRVDFVYMDVQGAEMMVLEGAGKFINQIKAIWLEVESVELYKDQPLKKEIESFMKRSGFIKVKDTVNDIAGDQLYVQKALISRFPGNSNYLTYTRAKHRIKKLVRLK